MIKKILLVFTVIFAFFACKSEDENLIPNQIAAIERFMTTNELEYEVIDGVYRHFGARGTENAQIVENGNLVGLMYEIYPSDYTRVTGSLTPHPATALSSNKPLVHAVLEANGGNTQYWPKDVYMAKVGSESLIDGLNKGLVGCRTGDSVLLFITSDLALEDAQLGPAAGNAALLYVINIESVTK